MKGSEGTELEAISIIGSFKAEEEEEGNGEVEGVEEYFGFGNSPIISSSSLKTDLN